MDNIDQRLAAALETANYRVTLNNQKKNAYLKLEKNLSFAFNGGIFKITSELIFFVSALIGYGKTDAVILDVNNNPIEITDLNDFQEVIMDKYYQFSNEYLITCKSVSQKRSTSAVIGL